MDALQDMEEVSGGKNGCWIMKENTPVSPLTSPYSDIFNLYYLI
jgi:hypothetical protein